MKNIAIAATALCVLIIYSCGQNEAGGPRLETARPNLPTLSTPSTPSANPVSPTGTPIAPIIASARLNPAHGQPGHRCDIAVGAALPADGSSPNLKLPTPAVPSLNLPAQKNIAPATVQAPVVTPAGASGLNPAHGQPGHRCDIPVGQPLNSKPSTATTTTPAVSTPVATTPPKSDGLFEKGLNPAHGLPGHRCDIPVGKPLNSTAKPDSLGK